MKKNNVLNLACMLFIFIFIDTPPMTGKEVMPQKAARQTAGSARKKALEREKKLLSENKALTQHVQELTAQIEILKSKLADALSAAKKTTAGSNHDELSPEEKKKEVLKEKIQSYLDKTTAWSNAVRAGFHAMSEYPSALSQPDAGDNDIATMWFIAQNLKNLIKTAKEAVNNISVAANDLRNDCKRLNIPQFYDKIQKSTDNFSELLLAQSHEWQRRYKKVWLSSSQACVLPWTDFLSLAVFLQSVYFYRNGVVSGGKKWSTATNFNIIRMTEESEKNSSNPTKIQELVASLPNSASAKAKIEEKFKKLTDTIESSDAELPSPPPPPPGPPAPPSTGKQDLDPDAILGSLTKKLQACGVSEQKIDALTRKVSTIYGAQRDIKLRPIHQLIKQKKSAAEIEAAIDDIGEH